MIKRFTGLFIFSLPLLVTAQQSIDVQHYKFSVKVTDNNDTLYGEAIITAYAPRGTSSLSLDLAGDMNNKQKGMNVTGVFLLTAGKPEPVSFTHVHDRLVIDTKSRSAGNDTITALVKYKGIPADGLIISKNKFGKRTFFADNWPNRAHYWLPCVDNPADKASVEFVVLAPAHYQVVANGILAEETDMPGDIKLTHWKEEIPLPTKVMVIGVAQFAVSNAGDINCIPVSSWVFPENRNEGFYDYAMAKDVLAWHIGYIGPYAYKKLANVQSKTIFGGMENASAIFYYEGSVTGKRTEEELFSHEIVHQWFGNMATEKSFAHLWLSEGFATYLTHVYMEARYGTEKLEQDMGAERATVLDFVKSNRRPVVDTTHDYMKLLNANSYQKGSWVLHMLRRQLGDSVFHKSIRDYYAAFAGKNADTKDLQKVFEKNAGKDLEQFFRQWLYTPENPELKISWQYLPAEKTVAVTVEQLQNTVFSFPLELATRSASARTHMIQVKERKETFKIPAGEKPLDLIPDPHVSLLAGFSVRETM
ncbi:MAG: M1 family aminopeptidase [Chitinophagaceae bacterium]